jgi:Fic family protein
MFENCCLFVKNSLNLDIEIPYKIMFKNLKIVPAQYLEKYIITANIDWKKVEKLFIGNSSNHVEQPDFEYYIQTSSVYSSNIEGNSIDPDTWLKNKTFKIKSKPKETAEIDDLIASYIFATKQPLTKKAFLQSHQLLSKTILSVKNQRGKLRNQPVGIYSNGRLEYLAVEPEFVEIEINKLFDDIALLLKTELSDAETFYFASLIHLIFEKIHPFMDGNGRAGRLLEKWFLAKKLGLEAWNLETEKYCFQHRQQYYQRIHIGLNYYVLKLEKSLDFAQLLLECLKQKI